MKLRVRLGSSAQRLFDFMTLLRKLTSQMVKWLVSPATNSNVVEDLGSVSCRVPFYSEYCKELQCSFEFDLDGFG